MRFSSLLLLAISAAASADQGQAGAWPQDASPAYGAPQNEPLPQGQQRPQTPSYIDDPASSYQQAAAPNAPLVDIPPANAPQPAQPAQPAQPPPLANPALADAGPFDQPPADVPANTAVLDVLANAAPLPASVAPPIAVQPPIYNANPQDAAAPIYPSPIAASVKSLSTAKLPLTSSRPKKSTSRLGKTGEGVVPTVTPLPKYPPATQDQYCGNVHDLIVAANARPQAGLYCSFKLNLKARPTITTTVSTTIRTTLVSTYTTSTEVVTRLARDIPKDVSLEILVVTKTLRGLDTRTVSSTVFPTEYYSCLSGPAGRMKLESQGQAANTQVPKPDIFSQFPTEGDITSACACLGLPTAPTATVTSAISSTSTVYSTEHEIGTSTSFVLPSGTSFSIRVPPTSTRLINSKSTVTYTHGIATNTAFALLGSNSRYARVDDVNMLHFSDNYTGPYSQVPTIFRLDPQTCALGVIDGVQFGAEGFIAVEATYPGQTLLGDTVRFEHPNSVGTGFSALLCHIEQSSQRLRCTMDGDIPNGGTMQGSEYWRLGPKSTEDFAIKAIPIDHGSKCLTHCRKHDDMLFLDGDQFVGQTVLQDCLAKCKKG